MTKLKKKPPFIHSAIALALLISQGLTACGKLNTSDEKSIEVKPAQQQVQMDETEELAHRLANLMKLFGGTGGGLTRDDVDRLLHKFHGLVDSFLPGGMQQASKIIDILFGFDENHDGKVTLGEVVDAGERFMPILRHIPESGGATRESLEKGIRAEYPEASELSVSRLAEMLLRADQTRFGGNGNGLLERTEIGTIAGMMGVVNKLSSTDLEQSAQTSPDTKGKAIFRLLIGRLDRQVYTQAGIRSYQKMSESDQRLELMILGTRYFLVDRLMTRFDRFDDVMAELKLQSVSQYPRFVKFYSSLGLSVFKKKEKDQSEQKLENKPEPMSPMQVLLMEIDHEFAVKIQSHLGGSFDGDKMAEDTEVLGELEQLLPKTYPTLLWKKKFLSSGKTFDSTLLDLASDLDDKDEGGNGNDQVDVPEFALALNFSELAEAAFQTFDLDLNNKITRNEVQSLLDFACVKEDSALDAFFANAGLESESPSPWAVLEVLLQKASPGQELEPREFHDRVINVCKRIFR